MKIGFYDSGLGGAKTLKDIIDMGLTGEIYYLADIKNCPYGTKDIEELKTIVDKNIQYLIKKGCQIIVVACNTATSVAIKDLRKKYPNVNFIGTEPAIKPALDDKHKKILVLATTRTVNGDKLHELIGENKDDVILLAADKLVGLIEDDVNNKEVINNYLDSILKKYDLNEISHIVLGCTHFPIVKDNIKQLVKDYDIKVIDGNIGIGKNLLKKVNKDNKLIITIVTTKNNGYIEKIKNILNISD